MTNDSASGLCAGTSVHLFNDDDAKNLIDYDGKILNLHPGTRF